MGKKVSCRSRVKKKVVHLEELLALGRGARCARSWDGTKNGGRQHARLRDAEMAPARSAFLPSVPTRRWFGESMARYVPAPDPSRVTMRQHTDHRPPAYPATRGVRAVRSDCWRGGGGDRLRPSHHHPARPSPQPPPPFTRDGGEVGEGGGGHTPCSWSDRGLGSELDRRRCFRPRGGCDGDGEGGWQVSRVAS